jgi:hypothetical protein
MNRRSAHGPAPTTNYPGADVALPDGGREGIGRTLNSPRWVAGGIFLMAFLACLFRPTSPSQRFALWGEDGNVFTQQVRASGILHSFFTTYAGYYNLLPRLVASIASALPLQWTPPVYAIASFLVISGATVIAWSSARGMGLNPWTCAAIAATVFILPAGDYEIFGTLTNVQWYVAAAAVVFVACWIGGYTPSPVPAAILIVVAGLTCPSFFTLAPAIAVTTLIRRRSLDWIVLSATLTAGVIQLWGASHSPPTAEGRHVAFGAHTGLDVFLVRIVDGAFVGSRLLDTTVTSLTWHGAQVLAAFVLAALLAFGVRQGFGLRQLVPLFLTAQAILFYIETMVLRSSDIATAGLALETPGRSSYAVAGRYMAAPALCLAVAAMILIDRLYATRFHGRQLIAAGLLGAWIIVLIVNFPVNLGRLPLRTWESSINAAQANCRTNPKLKVTVPNAPSGFVMTLTCHQAFG